MDAVYQILTYVLGGTTFMGVVSAIAYYKQNKRIKEAEAKQKEVDVEKAKIEARKSEIELLSAQLERAEKANEQKDKRMSELNDAIDKHIDRRHELADKLNESQLETNRVNRLLNEAKDEIIRLTEKSDRLEAVKCLRTDCKDPRGPKPPRKERAETQSPLPTKPPK